METQFKKNHREEENSLFAKDYSELNKDKL